MDSGTGTGGAESVLKVLATLAGALNTRQSVAFYVLSWVSAYRLRAVTCDWK